MQRKYYWQSKRYKCHLLCIECVCICWIRLYRNVSAFSISFLLQIIFCILLVLSRAERWGTTWGHLSKMLFCSRNWLESFWQYACMMWRLPDWLLDWWNVRGLHASASLSHFALRIRRVCFHFRCVAACGGTRNTAAISISATCLPLSLSPLSLLNLAHACNCVYCAFEICNALCGRLCVRVCVCVCAAVLIENGLSNRQLIGWFDCCCCVEPLQLPRVVCVCVCVDCGAD